MSAIGQGVFIITTVLLLKTVGAEAFYVPSGSMQPTLLIGDQLVVSKASYGYSRYSLPIAMGPATSKRLFGRLPDRGDVVVFRLPRDASQTYVKRVVGLPGDRIQMRNGRLWVNDKILPLRRDGVGQIEDEDGRTVLAERYIETLPGGREHPIFKTTWTGELDDTPVFEISQDHIFVMGDNRDNSADSRLSPLAGGVGMVPVENLVGQVEVVLGSWDLSFAKRPISTWASGLRLSRFFSRVH